jgi:hypothetical protein
MMPRLRRLVLAAAWLMFVSASSLPTASAQLLFRAERTNCAPVVGRVLSLSNEEVTLKSESGPAQSIPLKNLISLSQPVRAGWKILPAVGQSWVFLATGDRLCVEPTRIDDTELTAVWNRFEALPSIRIPLEACRGVAFTMPSDSVKQGLLLTSITDRTETSDLIVLRNGDRLQGELLGLADGAVTIETSLGKIQPKARVVERLVFNPELIFVEKPEGLVRTVLLSDGTVLKLKDASANGLTLTGTLLAGTKVALPLEEIHELTVSGGDVVPLAEVAPDRQTIASFLDTKRPPRGNRNVLGGLLTMCGRPNVTGVGVASGTTLEWDLDGSWRSFQATVGIDDAARGRGSVIFEVRVDDRSVWRSEVLTGLSKPVAVPPVNLAGAKKLTLIVEFAQQGNVLDYANWADAVLIRAE